MLGDVWDSCEAESELTVVVVVCFNGDMAHGVSGEGFFGDPSVETFYIQGGGIIESMMLSW